MRIIVVDDERRALNALVNTVKKAAPQAEVVAFDDSEAALEHAKQNKVDIGFLDVQMPGLNGIALAKKLKELQTTINIIFVTGYSEYAAEAFLLRASGYVQKPVQLRDVQQEFENLRYPVQIEDTGIRIHTFGNFEVFKDGEKVQFGLAKSKEILAYLVDRNGASVTRKELASILWGDVQYSRALQTHLQILISDMQKSLTGHGAGHIVIRGRNSLSVDTKAFSCDYYNFLNGDARAINSFTGEYMANYSWAEFTAGALDRQKIQYED